jgi:hypothetical protein
LAHFCAIFFIGLSAGEMLRLEAPMTLLLFIETEDLFLDIPFPLILMLLNEKYSLSEVLVYYTALLNEFLADG